MDVWGALADRSRREILDLLKDRPYTAGELADQFSLSQATVSHHLAVLRETTIIYSLDPRALRQLMRGLDEFLST